MNDRARVTRRAVLGSALAVAAGGAAAVGGWFTVRERRAPAPPPAPRAPVLEAELAREVDLLARYDATIDPPPGVATAFAGLRADHSAHADALRALLAGLGVHPSAAGASPSIAGSPSIAAPVPFGSVAELITDETFAARSTAAASQQLAGPAAATLASISACESTHVVVLG